MSLSVDPLNERRNDLIERHVVSPNWTGDDILVERPSIHLRANPVRVFVCVDAGFDVIAEQPVETEPLADTSPRLVAEGPAVWALGPARSLALALLLDPAIDVSLFAHRLTFRSRDWLLVRETTSHPLYENPLSVSNADSGVSSEPMSTRQSSCGDHIGHHRSRCAAPSDTEFVSDSVVVQGELDATRLARSLKHPTQDEAPGLGAAEGLPDAENSPLARALCRRRRRDSGK